MSETLNKQKRRLKLRQDGYVAGKNRSTRLPGSMNTHKSMPLSGRRTRAAVKQASRAATGV